MDIHHAKTIALKYLSSAQRSVREVELKLKQKGFEEDIIKQTIVYLKSYDYLNDEAFAKQWAASKIKLRSWGKIRITHGLRQKGISEKIIRQTLDVPEQEANELNTARTALEKWLNEKVRSQESEVRSKEKIKQKVFRHLQNKGFTTEVIFAVTKQHFGASEINESE